MHHVVIGAGPAGVTACETLRQLDGGALVTLIGEEPEPPYSRMAIPYFLTDKIAEEGTHLRSSADFYERHRIQVERTRVNRVDAQAHTLHLNDGASLTYDRLLIATGSSPTLPPVPGIESDGVLPCWTLADARRIHAHARPGCRAVLLGAGFIGCIILEALVARGVDLTVVEPIDRMVPRMMNKTAGGLLKRWCERKGVKVLTGTKAIAVQPGRKASDSGATGSLSVDLDSGRSLEAELVIRATGVRPNIGFLSGNLNMNVLDTLGLVSSSFGLWHGVEGGESVELLDPDRFLYLDLRFQEDRLVGASSLGLTENIGVIRGLIQSGKGLGVWRDRLLRDPTRFMEAYLASVQGVA